jgi:hypothetical protein
MTVGGISSLAAGYYTGVSQLKGGSQEGGGLSPEAQAQVQQLKAADQKVRQHEAAHQAAGAGLTGGANYQYVRGPDGRQYAVAGEVSINTSPAGSPEATLAKARQVRAAALAPADPSPQDRAVAAAAALLENQARAEISRKQQEGKDEGPVNPSATQADSKSRGENQAARAYAAAEAVTAAQGQTINAFA